MHAAQSGFSGVRSSFVYGILYWWPALNNTDRRDVWLALHRDERTYILRHLQSWTGVAEVVRDVLRAICDIVHAFDAHAALAHALLNDVSDEYLMPPKKGALHRCGLCREPGHTRRSCLQRQPSVVEDSHVLRGGVELG